jgi:ABC-2 type transport system permease protein
VVAHLLSLRWRVMRNGLRRSVWQVVALVIGGLYGVGILAALVAGLVALSFAPAQWAWTAAVLVGSVAVLGWAVVPLLARGVDQTLSVEKLRSFPIPADRLLVALLVCGVLGIPGIVTTVAALATSLSWLQHPLSAVVAPLSGLVGVLTCVAASRVLESLTTRLASRRRYREVMGVVVFVPVILAGPIIGFAGQGIGSVVDRLPRVAEVAAWTPLGAAWAVPGELALGRPLEALAKSVIALASLALLLLAWRRALASALVAPPVEDRAGSSKGLGPFRWFPATPTGAVAARAAVYWLRDPP